MRSDILISIEGELPEQAIAKNEFPSSEVIRDILSEKYPEVNWTLVCVRFHNHNADTSKIRATY